jgi:hypothetical protein
MRVAADPLVELFVELGDEFDDLPASARPPAGPGDLIVSASVVVADLMLEDLDARFGRSSGSRSRFRRR